jgi:prophage regulatory protein
MVRKSKYEKLKAELHAARARCKKLEQALLIELTKPAPPPPRDADDLSYEFMRSPDVRYATGLSKVTIYRMCRSGEFPSSIKLGPRVIVWRTDEVQAWMDEVSKTRRVHS